MIISETSKYIVNVNNISLVMMNLFTVFIFSDSNSTDGKVRESSGRKSN